MQTTRRRTRIRLWTLFGHRVLCDAAWGLGGTWSEEHLWCLIGHMWWSHMRFCRKWIENAICETFVQVGSAVLAQQRIMSESFKLSRWGCVWNDSGWRSSRCFAIFYDVHCIWIPFFGLSFFLVLCWLYSINWLLWFHTDFQSVYPIWIRRRTACRDEFHHGIPRFRINIFSWIFGFVTLRRCVGQQMLAVLFGCILSK